jgi:hypothetical protein
MAILKIPQKSDFFSRFLNSVKNPPKPQKPNMGLDGNMFSPKIPQNDLPDPKIGPLRSLGPKNDILTSSIPRTLKMTQK